MSSTKGRQSPKKLRTTDSQHYILKLPTALRFFNDNVYETVKTKETVTDSFFLLVFLHGLRITAMKQMGLVDH